MTVELTGYNINIIDNKINIYINETKESIEMILYTDYNYDVLNIGFGLGYLNKTILKAEYCKLGKKEYYDVSIYITIKNYTYIDIEGINMDTNELETMMNIKDKIISVNNEM